MANNEPCCENRDFKLVFPAFGVILLVVGVLLILGTIFPSIQIGKLWPLFMMVPVVILVASWIQYGKKSSGVVFPVVLLTFYTGYFLWLNFVGWDKTAVTWPNFLIGPALGFVGLYFTERKWGILVPAGMLLALAAIFYSVTLKSTYIVAILFIALGVLIIVHSILKMNKKRDKNI